MGFEINNQIKIPSNQVNKQTRFFTTKRVKQNETQNFNLNPWFLTGFIDA